MKNQKGYIDTLEILLIGSVLSLTAILVFVVYGIFFGIYVPIVKDGEHTGYITATQTSYWGNYNVYFKTELESSQEDIYCIRKDNPLIKEARRYREDGKRVTISYVGYFFHKATDCGYQIIEEIE